MEQADIQERLARLEQMAPDWHQLQRDTAARLDLLERVVIDTNLKVARLSVWYSLIVAGMGSGIGIALGFLLPRLF